MDKVTPHHGNSSGTKRSVSNLSGSVTHSAKITDQRVEKLLTGLYKSNNVNLYEFRRPTGTLSSTNPFTDAAENINQYSNLL